MPTYVVPVEITLDDPLGELAASGTQLCVEIEAALNEAIGDRASRIVALHPRPGSHRHTSTNPD